jgi:hypothetical protein
LEDLAKQLRFAPAETLRRQLERAEALAGEIDVSLNYPEDWLVFRVTGYRPQIDAPAMFVGEALLGDLSAFIERLSAAAGIAEADLNGDGYLTLAQLRERWGVSARTLERYRRMGLIARRVRGPRGRTTLAFPRQAVERFERTRPEQLESARGYSRIEPALRERMIRQAAAYRRRLGWSRDQVSRRLAERFGRGHETVRQILIKKDTGAASSDATFDEKGPPTLKERKLIDLAYWRWASPAVIASRLGRSKASVQRVINDTRAARLRRLLASEGGPLTLPPSAGRGAEKRPRPKRSEDAQVDATQFGEPGAAELLTLVHEARAIAPVTPAAELAWARRMHMLRARASLAVAALPKHGAASTALDRIETDLRAASRLKALLVRSQLPLLVRTLESTLGRQVDEVRGSLLLPITQESLQALAAAVDAFEPEKGGRLAGPAGLGLTRLATRFVREHATEFGGGARPRATSRLASGVAIADWTIALDPWQSLAGRPWLEPDERARSGRVQLDPRMREVLERRFGWGHEPGTLAEVARALGTTPMAIARIERAAIRRILSRKRAKP